MKVFAIGSYKGGVGKTTTTVNLAYDLSVKGYRVLVIDTDPQANTTYMYARVNSCSQMSGKRKKVKLLMCCLKCRKKFSGRGRLR